jgi:hypothetical protein
MRIFNFQSYASIICNLIYSFITYFFLFNDFGKNENKEFLDFLFFCRCSTQFLNLIFKKSTSKSAKVLNQEDSRFVDFVLQGEKITLFSTSNTIILQSMRSMFLKTFMHLILIV